MVYSIEACESRRGSDPRGQRALEEEPAWGPAGWTGLGEVQEKVNGLPRQVAWHSGDSTWRLNREFTRGQGLSTELSPDRGPFSKTHTQCPHRDCL